MGKEEAKPLTICNKLAGYHNFKRKNYLSLISYFCYNNLQKGKRLSLITLKVESSQFEMGQLIRAAIQNTTLILPDITQLILKYLRYSLFDLEAGKTLRFSQYHKLSVNCGYENAIICGESAVNAQTPDFLLFPYYDVSNYVHSFLTRFNLETFQSVNFNFNASNSDGLTIHGSTIFHHSFQERSIHVGQINDKGVTISKTIVVDAPEIDDTLDTWPGKLIFDPIRRCLFILKRDTKGSISVLNSNQQLSTYIPKEILCCFGCDFAAYLSDETIVGLYFNKVIKFNLINSTQTVIDFRFNGTIVRKACLAENYLALLHEGGKPITILCLSSAVVKPLVRPKCRNLCATNEGSFCILYEWGTKIDVVTPMPIAESQRDFTYLTRATLSLSHAISNIALYENSIIAMIGNVYTQVFYKFSAIATSASSLKRKKEEERSDHKVDK